MKRRVLAALAPVLALVAAGSVLVAGPADAAVPGEGAKGGSNVMTVECTTA